MENHYGIRELCGQRFLSLTKLVAIALLTLATVACTSSKPDRNALATQGKIQEDAPVKAVAEIVVAAPPAKVWALLADIRNWPKWQPDIDSTSIQQAAAAGVPFVWSMGGMTIHSTLRRVDAEHTICWTGRAWHIQAIHCWSLSASPGGGTLVRMKESMDGWLISHLFSSGELLQGDQHWLQSLKQAGER